MWELRIANLLSIMLFLCCATSLFAADNNQGETVPSFTDQDLKKYGYPSERNKPNGFKSPDKADMMSTKDTGKEKKRKLRRYEVPYETHEGRKILIPVTFNDSVTASMLLDTGATGTHISTKLADKLGLFNKEEGNLLKYVSGIGGTIPVTLAIIDKIQIGEAEDNFIPSTIAPSISEEFEGLLGMDFMTDFSIQIDTKKHIVTFEELPPQPDMPGGHDENWWKEHFHEFASTRAEWKKIRDNIYGLYHFQDASQPVEVPQRGKRTSPITVGEIRKYVDSQHEEADKLFRRLDGYAMDNNVPMEWREY
jgi:predicted aspartyl protease